MERHNIWYVPPQGSTIEKAIINTLNFVTDIVYEKMVKPNGEKLDKNINDTEILKLKSTDNLEQLLDTQFELETTKDEVVDNYEQLLDLQFEVEQLKDNIGG